MDAFLLKGFYTIGALKTNRIIFPADVRQNISRFARFILKSYTTYVQSANTAGIAYLVYESAETNTYEAYVNYTLSEFAVTPDPEEDTEEDEPEDTTTESDVNPWLLGSSIAISAVLILAVISLIVRKAWAVSRKKRNQQASKK